MPFTLSHPAAVVPLRRVFRGRIPFLALVAGSLSPDFGYFFTPCDYFRADAHTFLRSFSFCLPVGLFLLMIFFLSGKGFCRLIPETGAIALRRLAADSVRPLAKLPGVCAGVLIGAWTHILWDSFTHANGYFVKLLPALSSPDLFGIRLFRILQHGSTLLGAWVILRLLLREARPAPWHLAWNWKWALWLSISVAATLFTCLTYFSEWNLALMGNDRRRAFQFVVSELRNLGVLAVLASWLARAIPGRLSGRLSGGLPGG